MTACYALGVKKLVLFDIDGTLLNCGKQVGHIFLEALEETYGAFRKPERYSFAGKTDPLLVIEMVRGAGLNLGDIHAGLPNMRELYVRRLQERLDPAKVNLLPGVVELLERLARRDDVVLGLVTGNWRDGARIKLSPFSLGRFFSFGAFGDDGLDRRELVPVALDRARRAGHSFGLENVLVVGDTPLDVDCAHAAGVRCLAVATGHTESDHLRQVGADWVFSDLLQASSEFNLFR